MLVVTGALVRGHTCSRTMGVGEASTKCGVGREVHVVNNNNKKPCIMAHFVHVCARRDVRSLSGTVSYPW